MEEIENLIRDAFRAREDEVPDAAGLAAAARSGHARHAVTRRQLLVVSAVGVLAVGGSSALALARNSSRAPSGAAADARMNGRSQSPTTTPSQGTSATGPQPGTRAWSSHGLQVRVPESWKANQVRCMTPIAPTVLIGDVPMAACGISVVPAVDVVAFGPTTFLGLHPEPTLHPTTVSGHTAQTSTRRLPDGRTVTVLVVPDLDVSVTVESKDTSLVAGIIGSAQIVDTDANGCASQATTVEPTGEPAHPGAQTTMVPDKPVNVIVCHYAAPYSPRQATFNGPTLLTNGSTLAPDQINKLTDILNTLKPGQTTGKGLTDSCLSAAHDGYLFRFTYASGQPVDVYLHTLDCDQNGFSNGAVTGNISQKFVDNVEKFLPDMDFGVASYPIK